MSLRVRYDGLERRKKNDDHSEGLDRTIALHERQTRAMLYGAVQAKELQR